jgi:hypothetical protein
MAFATISVTNGIEIKKVPLGFSWTTFLFGGWPALLRQDWIVGIAVILASLATYGLAGVIFAFMYNKVYAKALFAKGYWVHALPSGTDERDVIDYLGLLSLPTPPASK